MRVFVCAAYRRDVVARFVSRGTPRLVVGRGRPVVVVVVRALRGGPVVGARVRQARSRRAQLSPSGAAIVGRPSRLQVLFVRVRLVGHRAQAERGPRAQEGVRPEGCHAQSVLHATAQSTYSRFSHSVLIHGTEATAYHDTVGRPA